MLHSKAAFASAPSSCLGGDWLPAPAAEPAVVLPPSAMHCGDMSTDATFNSYYYSWQCRTTATSTWNEHDNEPWWIEKNQALYSVLFRHIAYPHDMNQSLKYYTRLAYPVLLLLLSSPLILVILSIIYRGWHAYLLTWKKSTDYQMVNKYKVMYSGLAENLWADSTKFRQIWELYSVWN